MNAPRYLNTWNPTTVLAAVNLALVLFAGGGAYTALRQATLALAQADIRHETTLEQLRTDALAREARLRVLEQGAGRTDARLEAIAAGIDRLNDQIDRLLEEPGERLRQRSEQATSSQQATRTGGQQIGPGNRDPFACPDHVPGSGHSPSARHGPTALGPSTLL